MRAWAPAGLPTIGSIMQALRLNEVLTRVVAWHNRHPLARRISASQVHSIGEVVLPFASAQVAPAPPGPPALPPMRDLLDPVAAPLAGLPASADGLAFAAQPADDAEPAAAPGPTGPPAEPGPVQAADAAAQTDPPDAPADAPAEPAPVLSMDDEGDDLFSADPPPAGEPAAPPDDGPEMLVELSSDPDEPPPESAADGPRPAAHEPAPELAATDADSAEPAAAFTAATDLDAAPLAATAAAAAAAAAPDSDLPADPRAHPRPDLADGRPADPAPPASDGPAASQPLELPADNHQPAAPQPQTAAASASPAGLLARLLACIRGWRRGSAAGLPRLQATFSRDFIWPLRPGQVARWARRHGSVVPLAPADWPRRLIDIDGSLLAQARRQGLPHDLPLHLLTAAIGVGDRRIRVLVDAQGHILGPRSYSPPKLAAVASLVAVGLVGAGWGWLPRADSLSANQTRAVVAAAESAAAQAASAAELAAAAASAADRVWRAQQARSMLAGTAPADAPLAEAPPTETALTVAPDNAHTAAPPAKPAPHGGEAEAWAHAAASAPKVTSDTSVALATAATAATAATSGADPPDPTDPTVTPARRQAMLPLGTVLPVLSAADKLAARQQVEAARKGQAAAIALQAPKPATPVFAIVTRPTREKSSAARGLALIRASGQRLTGELPEHGELMLNQGEWRAAWWPFESLADAERARLMLAARGLKVEVVEF